VTLFSYEREAHDAWVSLGFGMLGIDALCDLGPLPGAGADVEIERMGPDEIGLVELLELGLHRHLASSPSLIPLLIAGGRTAREEWLAQPDRALWIATQAREASAWLCVQPSKATVLPVESQTTAACTGAYTVPAARGSGMGSALLEHALAWAREQGYTHCAVEFETANLLATAFWLGRGFEPVCTSLERRIDPRLAWAGAERDEADVWRAWAGRSAIG
jgi:GNAT superfamily N-acetyltransferase